MTSHPGLAPGPSSASARLGSGLADDTRVLLTELLRLTRFSLDEAEIRLVFGNVSRCRLSAVVVMSVERGRYGRRGR